MEATIQPFINKGLKNPFVGLRPFEMEESLLFFGRNKQIGELLQKLYTNRFLSVVGSSGCGKSSLIRAGLIPKLKAGFLTQKFDQWQIAIMRPGDDPLYFLAESILKASEGLAPTDAISQDQAEKTIQLKEELIRKGKTAATDLFMGERKQANILLLIDQFEEIFRYKTNHAQSSPENHSGSPEADEEKIIFVNIILALAEQSQLPIYVVLTMRSDFIGLCNQFYGLPEAMNEGQYLVPKLDRQQRKQAIEGPIHIFNAEISNSLLNRLLNDSETIMDELPILQHALMRTWSCWKKNSDDSAPLDLQHYLDKHVGGLEHALSIHADEIYNSLTQKEQTIAKTLFKSLTDITLEGKKVRYPQDFQSLVNICTSEVGTADEVTKVIDAFRKEDCAFLTPYKGDIDPDTMIDISHESLMRQWKRLEEWMLEEQKSARTYKWLAECASEKRELLQDFDLKTAAVWQQTQKPNGAWAARYSTNYNEVINYINKSISRKRKRKAWIFTMSGLLLIACIGALYYYNYTQQKTQTLLLASNVALESQLAAEDRAKRLVEEINNSLLREKRLTDTVNKVLLDKLDAERRASALAKRSLSDKLLTAAEKARREEAEKQNKLLQTKIHIINIQKQSFYSSSLIDSSTKERIVGLLLPLADENKTAEFNNALESINLSIRAREIAPADPNKGLYLIYQATNTYKNFFTDSTAKTLLKNYAFYKLKDFGSFYSSSTLISSQDPYKWVSINSSSITKATYDHGKLNFDYFTTDYSEDEYRYNTTITSDTSSFLDVESYENDSLSTLTSTDTIGSLYNLPNSYVNTYAYDGQKIIYHLEENNLYKISLDSGLYKKDQIKTFTNEELYSKAAFSPDGSLLLTDNPSSIVYLWSLKGNEISKLDSLTRVKSNRGRSPIISLLQFAPNNNEFSIAYAGGNIELWSTDMKLVNTFTGKNEKSGFNKADKRKDDFSVPESEIESFQMSRSGEYYIAFFSDGALRVWDRGGNLKDLTFLERFNTTLDKENAVTISPQGRFILLASKNNGTILADTEKKAFKILAIPFTSTQSSFKGAYYNESEEDTKYQRLDEYTVTHALFLDEETLMTSNQDGEVRLWMTNPGYTDLQQAFNSDTPPYLLTREKLDLNYLNYETISSSTKPEELLSAISYFNDLAKSSKYQLEERIENHRKAITLHNKYLQLDSSVNNGYDLYLALTSNLLDKLQGSSDYHTFAARIKQTLPKAANYYINNIKLNTSYFNEYFSIYYSELAWNQLLSKDNEGALNSIDKALTLDPTEALTIKSAAACYLVNGQYDKALALYNEHKNDKNHYISYYFDNEFLFNYYPDLTETEDANFSQYLLKDIDLLTKRGLITKEDPAIKEIIDLLKSED